MKKLLALILTTGTVFLNGCIGQRDLEMQKVEMQQGFNEYLANRQVEDRIYTLNECIKIAIENNLEIYALKIEQEVADIRKSGKLWEMLPQLTAEARHTDRNNEAGSSSVGIEDDIESLRPSTSTERDVTTFRLEAALSILDFGFSYLNAQYEENQRLLSVLKESKAKRDLALQVIQSYYNVAAAQSILPKAKNQLINSEKAFKKAEELYETKQINKMEMFAFKKKFLETSKILREYERSHMNYSLNLTSLLGLMPNSKILVDTSFAVKDDNQLIFPHELPKLADIEKTALEFREEVYESILNLDISKIKSDTEFLKLFPNVKLFASYNESSNDFLYNKSWYEQGAQVAYDLLSLPSQLKKYEAQLTEEQVVRFRGYATTLAIVAQVRIAYSNLEEVKERFEYRSRFHLVVEEEKAFTKKAIDAGTVHELLLIEKELDETLSYMQQVAALANFHVAHSRLYHAAGLKDFHNAGIEAKVDESNQNSNKKPASLVLLSASDKEEKPSISVKTYFEILKESSQRLN